MRRAEFETQDCRVCDQTQGKRTSMIIGVDRDSGDIQVLDLQLLFVFFSLCFMI